MASSQHEEQQAHDGDGGGFRETRVLVPAPADGAGDAPLAGVLTEPVVGDASASTSTSTSTRSSSSPKPWLCAADGRDCALLVHGFASTKNGYHLPALARHLAAELGLSSLRLDVRGSGGSRGAFRFGGMREEAAQLEAARAWLEGSRGKRVVLLLGHSRGAITITLHQGRFRRVPLLVLCAGRFDLSLNMRQRYGDDVLQRLRETGPWPQASRRECEPDDDPDDGGGGTIHWLMTAAEMEERLSLDVAGACAAIKAAAARRGGGDNTDDGGGGGGGGSSGSGGAPRVLVVHGGSDPICAEGDARRLAEATGARLAVVGGGDHWLRGRLPELRREVERFLRDAWPGWVFSGGASAAVCAG